MEKLTRKRALITGVTGQDGAYLSRFLLEKDYDVYGTFRRISTPNFWRLQSLNIIDKINLIPIDLIDGGSIFESVGVSKPNEIYNLAAQSFVGGSFEYPEATADISGLAVTRFLEAIRQLNPKIRFYQASTSELYGTNDNSGKPQNEETKFMPASPYAAAKLYAFWMTKIYREAHDIFACNGILFNHESPNRGLDFVTRKISNSVARIKLGLQDKLEMGNIHSKRDWGYAPDYVKSMWLMLQQEKPDDYVIATNETYSVKEFLEEAFSHVDLDWEKYVQTEKGLFRPLDVNFLQGDYSKAEKQLGWKPQIKFKELVKIMVDEDIKRWKGWGEGKRFPWDAPNHLYETGKIPNEFELSIPPRS